MPNRDVLRNIGRGAGRVGKALTKRAPAISAAAELAFPDPNNPEITGNEIIDRPVNAVNNTIRSFTGGIVDPIGSQERVRQDEARSGEVASPLVRVGALGQTAIDQGKSLFNEFSNLNNPPERDLYQPEPRTPPRQAGGFNDVLRNITERDSQRPEIAGIPSTAQSGTQPQAGSGSRSFEDIAGDIASLRSPSLASITGTQSPSAGDNIPAARIDPNDPQADAITNINTNIANSAATSSLRANPEQRRLASQRAVAREPDAPIAVQQGAQSLRNAATPSPQQAEFDLDAFDVNEAGIGDIEVPEVGLSDVAEVSGATAGNAFANRLANLPGVRRIPLIGPALRIAGTAGGAQAARNLTEDNVRGTPEATEAAQRGAVSSVARDVVNAGVDAVLPGNRRRRRLRGQDAQQRATREQAVRDRDRTAAREAQGVAPDSPATLRERVNNAGQRASQFRDRPTRPSLSANNNVNLNTAGLGETTGAGVTAAIQAAQLAGEDGGGAQAATTPRDVLNTVQPPDQPTNQQLRADLQAAEQARTENAAVGRRSFAEQQAARTDPIVFPNADETLEERQRRLAEASSSQRPLAAAGVSQSRPAAPQQAAPEQSFETAPDGSRVLRATPEMVAEGQRFNERFDPEPTGDPLVDLINQNAAEQRRASEAQAQAIRNNAPPVSRLPPSMQPEVRRAQNAAVQAQRAIQSVQRNANSRRFQLRNSAEWRRMSGRQRDRALDNIDLSASEQIAQLSPLAEISNANAERTLQNATATNQQSLGLRELADVTQNAAPDVNNLLQEAIKAQGKQNSQNKKDNSVQTFVERNSSAINSIKQSLPPEMQAGFERAFFQEDFVIPVAQTVTNANGEPVTVVNNVTINDFLSDPRNNGTDKRAAGLVVEKVARLMQLQSKLNESGVATSSRIESIGGISGRDGGLRNIPGTLKDFVLGQEAFVRTDSGNQIPLGDLIYNEDGKLDLDILSALEMQLAGQSKSGRPKDRVQQLLTQFSRR